MGAYPVMKGAYPVIKSAYPRVLGACPIVLRAYPLLKRACPIIKPRLAYQQEPKKERQGIFRVLPDASQPLRLLTRSNRPCTFALSNHLNKIKMAQELERSFNMSDDAMLERAQVFHDRLALELPDYTIRFPWMDAVWLTAFQNDITAADAFPKDDSVTLSIKVLTGDVKGAMQQSYAALQSLGGYAKLAYKTDLMRQRVFGQQNWGVAYNNTLKLQESLELAHAKANDASFKADLIAKGYTQIEIDQLATLATGLQTKNGLQEAAKAGRKVTSRDRTAMLNVVWEDMTTVNICASVVWASDAARMGQYQLYPSVGDGDDEDDEEPTATIKISGTVASNMFPLPNAAVMVSIGMESYPTIAGAAGIYSVSVPNPSVQTPAIISASGPNVIPENRNIMLEPNENQTQDFNLTSAPPMP